MLTDALAPAKLHSIEAEQAVLGCMLQSPRAISEAIDEAKLTAEMFFRPAHRIIFGAIERLVRQGREVDHLTVRVLLEDQKQLKEVGGIDYLFDIEMQAPAISNARYYADAVVDKFRLRGLQEASKRISELVADPDIETLDEKIDLAYEALDQIRQAEPERDSTMVHSIAKEYFQIIDQGVQGKTVPMISTGFPALDRKLNGGMRRGGIYAFGAGPKDGKTSFAVSMLRNLATAHLRDGSRMNSVMYFSMELHKVDVMSRLVAATSGIETNYTSGIKQVETDKQYIALGDACDTLQQTLIEIIDRTKITTAEINRLVAAKRRTAQGIDVVIVDYYQLVSPAFKEKGDSEYARLSRVSSELREIAKKHDVVIVLIYQQADSKVKGRDGGRPTSTDIHGCTQLGKDCFALAHLFRTSAAEGGNHFGSVESEVILHYHRYGMDRTAQARLVYQETRTRYQSHPDDLEPAQEALLP